MHRPKCFSPHSAARARGIVAGRAKNDSAVVALEHEVCTGCHMKLTPSTAAKTKAGREIPHCEQCGRILYAGS